MLSQLDHILVVEVASMYDFVRVGGCEADACHEI